MSTFLEVFLIMAASVFFFAVLAALVSLMLELLDE